MFVFAVCRWQVTLDNVFGQYECLHNFVKAGDISHV